MRRSSSSVVDCSNYLFIMMYIRVCVCVLLYVKINDIVI